MKQEMIGWQWHQPDDMRIIQTSLKPANHASTSSVIFYRPHALPDAQPADKAGNKWKTEELIIREH